MANITFIEHDGTEHTVNAESGMSVMMAALNDDIPGIDADCGGAGACGTCHCFVADDWQDRTGEADALEQSMLAMRPDRVASSRLSCQIDVTEEMDGMLVRLPEFQM